MQPQPHLRDSVHSGTIARIRKWFAWPLWTPVTLAVLVWSYLQLPLDSVRGYSAVRYWLEWYHPLERKIPIPFAIHQVMLYRDQDGAMSVWVGETDGTPLSNHHKPPGRPVGLMYLRDVRYRTGPWAISREEWGMEVTSARWFTGPYRGLPDSAPLSNDESKQVLRLVQRSYDTQPGSSAVILSTHVQRLLAGNGPEVRHFALGHAINLGVLACFLLLARSYRSFWRLIDRVTLGRINAALRRRHEHRIRLCQHCGYEIAGVPGPVCPECGRPHGVVTCTDAV